MSDGGFQTDPLIVQLVAILFTAGEAVERRAVQRSLGITAQQLTNVIEATRERGLPGLMVQEHEDTLRLVTSPDAAFAVRRFLQAGPAARLSPAALEALAVIAYSQPATRAQVQEARGVNSDAAIDTLLQHALIVEVGRADGPGRPVLFQTTSECLSLLGISSLAELPTLTGDQALAPASEPVRLPTNST